MDPKKRGNPKPSAQPPTKKPKVEPKDDTQKVVAEVAAKPDNSAKSPKKEHQSSRELKKKSKPSEEHNAGKAPVPIRSATGTPKKDVGRKTSTSPPKGRPTRDEPQKKTDRGKDEDEVERLKREQEIAEKRAARRQDVMQRLVKGKQNTNRVHAIQARMQEMEKLKTKIAKAGISDKKRAKAEQKMRNVRAHLDVLYSSFGLGEAHYNLGGLASDIFYSYALLLNKHEEMRHSYEETLDHFDQLRSCFNKKMMEYATNTASLRKQLADYDRLCRDLRGQVIGSEFYTAIQAFRAIAGEQASDTVIPRRLKDLKNNSRSALVDRRGNLDTYFKCRGMYKGFKRQMAVHAAVEAEYEKDEVKLQEALHRKHVALATKHPCFPPEETFPPTVEEAQSDTDKECEFKSDSDSSESLDDEH